MEARVTSRRHTGGRPEAPPTRSRLERFLGARRGDDARYLVYLIVIATLGWALASYDFNLLVVALPTIAKDLGMSQTQVGAVAFFV
jgi:hypothetical protein